MNLKPMLGGLCLLLALQLAGCDKLGPAAADPTETEGLCELRVAPEDINQGFQLQSFVETPEGYFYGREVPSTYGPINMIFFCPRGESDFYPLCSKANCQHRDQNCNAHYAEVSFGYYNGALYTTEHGWDGTNVEKVVKLNLDGTDHRVVAEIDIGDSTSYLPFFHHGRLYLLVYANQELPLEEQEDRLIILDLADYSQTEPATEYLHKTFLTYFPKFYRDKLYGDGCPYKTYDSKAKDEYVVEIDTVTGEARFLTPTYTNSFYVTDSTLYYLEADWRRITEAVCKRSWDDPAEIPAYLDSFFEGYTQPEIGFWEYDLASGATKNCGMPIKNPTQAVYDEDYVYLYALPEEGEELDELELHFLSRAYEPLDQMNLPAGTSIAAVTSDRIFFCSEDGTITHSLDRSQIGSHNLELQAVENH